jgi:hypothetical protein
MKQKKQINPVSLTLGGRVQISLPVSRVPGAGLAPASPMGGYRAPSGLCRAPAVLHSNIASNKKIKTKRRKLNYF